MTPTEIIPGLPWPILYMVHSVYDLMSDSEREFLQHKDTGIPTDVFLPESEVLARAYEEDFTDLQFSPNDSSRGRIVDVVSQTITKILVRG